MAQGDLTYVVHENKGKLSTPQVQKLRVFLDRGVWDGEMEEITDITVSRSRTGVYVTLCGVRTAPPEDVPYPAHIISIEK